VTQPFKLATVSSAGSPAFVAIVIGDVAHSLAAVHEQYRAGRIGSDPLRGRMSGMLALLEDWDASFDGLSALVEFIAREGEPGGASGHAAATIDRLRFHGPIPQPPTMFFAAVNYPRPGRPGRDPGTPHRPYMFEKTARCVAGAHDDIVKPVGFDDIDWEVELALAIGRGGRRIAPERALEHVAGYLVANDITCRGFRQKGELPIPGPDWFGSKCHETFAPLGPYLVPKAFVPDCRNLRLTLRVNGELRQDGNTRDMVFSPEEQIAHVSNQLALQPGDIFATGTPEGFGAQSDRFLRVGDVIEAAIEGLGAQRNRLVASPAGR
jgi:2-keto-4-pentenoate hydratase/2-oxohepta-3-ene-1,7-dioic acid hydratase in catechol pathway